MRKKDSDCPIYVTRPLLPDRKEYYKKVNEVFDSGFLTNQGAQLQQFEKALREFLHVTHVMAFCNGTLALQLACKALDLKGEVITTPFTFPATTHAISWNGLTPVFCDIEPDTFNINPDKIEALITDNTSAILPVHVFGNPCRVYEINQIAKKHNLKVIYDAAHAFGVEINGQPIGSFGDISMFSFHATKSFNTLEGGALTFNDAALADKLFYLKNFGIKSETEVVSIGTNAKMNELQAAFGLLVLDKINEEIQKRKELTKQYRERLKNIPGLRCLHDIEGVKHNYQYFPIIIDETKAGFSRNDIYEELKKYKVYSRKYFYPLASQVTCYRELTSASKGGLPVAERITQSILCLPLYGELPIPVVARIAEIIISLSGRPILKGRVSKDY